MPEPRTVHDHLLLSYEVDCEARRITFHTVFRDREPHEYTDVVFEEVVAYHIEGDTFGTILFDIAEVPVEELFATEAWLFERGKNYGWPAVPGMRMGQDPLEVLAASGVRGFEIQSSCGLDGFVLARAMVFQTEKSPGEE